MFEPKHKCASSLLYVKCPSNSSMEPACLILHQRVILGRVVGVIEWTKEIRTIYYDFMTGCNEERTQRSVFFAKFFFLLLCIYPELIHLFNLGTFQVPIIQRSTFKIFISKCSSTRTETLKRQSSKKNFQDFQKVWRTIDKENFSSGSSCSSSSSL